MNTIKRWLTDHIENFLGQDPSGIIQGMSDFLEVRLSPFFLLILVLILILILMMLLEQEILDPVRNPSQNFAREASNVQKLVQQKLKGEVGPSAVIYNFPEDSVPEPSPPLHDSKYFRPLFPSILSLGSDPLWPTGWTSSSTLPKRSPGNSPSSTTSTTSNSSWFLSLLFFFFFFF